MKNKELVEKLFNSKKIEEQGMFPPILVDAVRFPKVPVTIDAKIWLLSAHYYMSMEALKVGLIKNLVRNLENVYYVYNADTYQDNLYSMVKKINSIGHNEFVRQEEEILLGAITDEIFKSWISRRFFENFLNIETNKQLIIPALRVLDYSAVLINLFVNPEEKALDILEALL